MAGQGGKRRALLAWEHGAGRGHIVTLRTVARALADRYEFDAGLCRMQHAGEIAPLCSACVQGASLRYDSRPRQGPNPVLTSTWGEFMGDLGFRDPAFLAERIAWWQDRLLGRRISLVIGDYAPLALLAARSMGLATIAVGQGYGLAPHGLREFPVFLPEFPHRLYDEAEMVAAVNAAGAPLGLDPIAHLPEVYAADLHLVRTLPMLDPYDGLRRDPVLPPVTDVASRASQGRGDEVFVYFSYTEGNDPGVVEAVAQLGLPVRAFVPGLAPEQVARLAASGAAIETGPVPVDLLAARSRIIVNSGQHGILCLGLFAGLPQVCVPQHLEQYYHARRAEQAGVAEVLGWGDRSAATFGAMIRRVYEDAGRALRARELAAELRAAHPRSGDMLMAERLAAL